METYDPRTVYQELVVAPILKEASDAEASKLKIGDIVHAGLSKLGGAGFEGVVKKIEDGWVWLEKSSAFDKFGPRMFKAPIANVLYMGESKNHLEEAKANWTEIDFLHETRELLLNSAYGNPPCWCRAAYSKGNKHAGWCQTMQVGFKGLEQAIKAAN